MEAEQAEVEAEAAAAKAAATKFAVDVDPLTGQDRAVAQAQWAVLVVQREVTLVVLAA